MYQYHSLSVLTERISCLDIVDSVYLIGGSRRSITITKCISRANEAYSPCDLVYGINELGVTGI